MKYSSDIIQALDIRNPRKIYTTGYVIGQESRIKKRQFIQKLIDHPQASFLHHVQIYPLSDIVTVKVGSIYCMGQNLPKVGFRYCPHEILHRPPRVDIQQFDFRTRCYIMYNDLLSWYSKGHMKLDQFNFPMLNPHRQVCKYGPHLIGHNTILFLMCF